MLGRGLGAIAGFVSKSDTVQKKVIKPEIKKQLQKGSEKFNQDFRFFTKLIKIQSVQNYPELHETLQNLRQIEVELTNVLISDEILDPIVKIIGNHVGDYKSIEEFEAALKVSESVHNMQLYATTALIDISHYSTLSDIIREAQSIESKGTEEQSRILTSLQDSNMIEIIKEENARLDPDAIKTTFESMAQALHSELKLKEKESQQLIEIYHKLTDKYLPQLNNIRKELLEHLPKFLQLEVERILTVCPHLVISQHAESETKAITTSLELIKEKEPKQRKKSKTTVDVNETEQEEKKSSQNTRKKKKLVVV